MASILVPLAIAGAGTVVNYFLRPRIKQQPVDIGRYDRIDITGSEYGSYILKGWGKFRTNGNFIFSTGINETIINTPSPGGKGSPSAPAERTFHYDTDVMIQFCRGEIDSFGRIWADANIISNAGTPVTEELFEAEDATLSGSAASYVDATASGGNAVQNIGSGSYVTFDTSGVPSVAPEIPIDPDELPEPYTRVSFFYKSNADDTVELLLNGTDSEAVVLPNSSNEWTVRSVVFQGHLTSLRYGSAASTDPNLDKISIYKYVINIRIDPRHIDYHYSEVSGLINPNIAYPTDLDDPSEFYNFKPEKDAQGEVSATNAVASSSIRLYTGTETQTQDAAIIAYYDDRFGSGEGVLRTSAFRGMALVMLENRVLKNGRIENYTAEIIEGTTSAQTVIEEILESIDNLTSDNYDASAAAGKTQIGFIDHTQQTRNQLLDFLMRWHHLRLGEIDGVITVIDMDAASVYTFDADNMRAFEYGGEPPSSDAEVIKKEPYLIPRQIRVSFMDTRIDYRNNSAESLPVYSESGTEPKEFSFPMIATYDEAQEVADVLHAQELREDKIFNFTTLPKGSARYSIGDVVTVPVNGRDYNVRIEKIRRQLPIGLINYECVLTSQTIFENYQAGIINDNPPIPPKQLPPPAYPANSQVVVIQTAPVRESDFNKLGFYAAVSRRGRGTWSNAVLYVETETDNWEPLSVFNTASPIGVTQSLFKETTDEETDVYFFEDVDLESRNLTALSTYQNLIYIGEIGSQGAWRQIQTFTQLELDQTTTFRSAYNMTDINNWVGLFGTEDVPNNHNAGSFVTVFTQAMQFIELPPQYIGETVRLKAVTGGQNIDYAPITEFVFSPMLSNAPIAAADLTGGHFVNVYDDAGTTKVRLADASDPLKFANGFVLEDYATAAEVYVRNPGELNYKSIGSAAGTNWLSASTPGEATTTPPSGSGDIVQILGTATADKYVRFNPSNPIEKA